MLFNEGRNIMDEAGNKDERSLSSLFLVALPADDGKIVAVCWPSKSFLSLLELLKLHGELALADFVLREDLQMTGKSDLLASPDKPFGRIVLVPFDGISVVHGELMMEVVVAFANGD